MFIINATDYEGNRKIEKFYLDREYAYIVFLQAIKAEDAYDVVLIDGFTGEILYQWRKGEFEVFGGLCL